jgi:hypothetical protein
LSDTNGAGAKEVGSNDPIQQGWWGDVIYHRIKHEYLSEVGICSRPLVLSTHPPTLNKGLLSCGICRKQLSPYLNTCMTMGRKATTLDIY